MTPLEAARAFVAAGISVIPVLCDGTKRPAWHLLPKAPDPHRPDRFKPTWNPFRDRPPNDAELMLWFAGEEPAGIAAVCGPVSGGLECIDFDAGELFEPWLRAAIAEDPRLDDVLTVVETPRSPAGYHVWYRCPEVEGNQVLAFDPDFDNGPDRARGRKLIETRGEGGYAVLPGSPPTVHESGRPYRRVRGPRLTDVRQITESQRTILVALARTFDRGEAPEPRRPREAGCDLPPWEDFDRRGPGFDQLLPPGWELVAGTADDGRFRRPGKDRSWSASTSSRGRKSGVPLFRVFSSDPAVAPFRPDRTYGKSDVFALIECDGDYREAARRLREMGYGSQQRQKPNKPGASGRTPAEQEREEWPSPIPLDDPAGEVPPFPVEVLPRLMREFLRSVADSIGCPVDYPAVYSLGMVAGSLGAAYSVRIKGGSTSGHYEPSSLYLCVVAPPSAGKSPALKLVASPVWAESARRYAEAGEGQRSKVVPPYVADITVEKLGDMLREHPRGQLMIRDEMVAWIAGMNQYKTNGGSDRQFYLSAWAGEPIAVHRKSPDSPPVFIPHPCLTVVGGMQPDVFRRLKGDDDGFFERILFSYPDSPGMQPETWLSVDENLARRWSNALETIRDTPMKRDPDGRDRPYGIALDEAARGEWDAWTHRLAGVANDPSFPENLQGVASKLRAHAARLALVVHTAREAFGEHTRHEIGADDMKAGADLAAYFLGHARRVHGLVGTDDRIRPARRILEWLARQQGPAFLRSDLWRALRRNSLFRRPEDLLGPLGLLEVHRFIRHAGDTRQYARGTPADEYLISPLLSEVVHTIHT